MLPEITYQSVPANAPMPRAKLTEAMPDAPCQVCWHCRGPIDLQGHGVRWQIVCRERGIVLFEWLAGMKDWRRVEKFRSAS